MLNTSQTKLKNSAQHINNPIVVLDIDDFAFLHPGLDELLMIKKHYPNFKITCFTIPLPKTFFITENKKHFTEDKYKKWAFLIKKYDWIEIAIHGLTHIHNEMNCSYDKAVKIVKSAENIFKKFDLPFKKIFKAPYWQYSFESLRALKDLGYIVAEDRNNPLSNKPEGLKTYTYNWSFEEPMPDLPIIKGHGHTRDPKNGIDICLENIFKLPTSSQFKFISEL